MRPLGQLSFIYILCYYSCLKLFCTGQQNLHSKKRVCNKPPVTTAPFGSKSTSQAWPRPLVSPRFFLTSSLQPLSSASLGSARTHSQGVTRGRVPGPVSNSLLSPETQFGEGCDAQGGCGTASWDVKIPTSCCTGWG